jgi:hypothetical protein
VLIRFGHSRVVGLGTALRLCADGLVLAMGYLSGVVPGIAVASSAIAAGVVTEAVYVGLCVRPVLRDQLWPAAQVEQPLTLHSFLQFYTPLAITALLNMVVQPLISASLSRMPNALDSLAVWSVVSGFVFMLRSASYAYNEVVIALLDEPRAVCNLRRFANLMAVLTSAILLAIAVTPLAAFWFGQVSALNSRLVMLARAGLWIALPIPALDALQSWYRGTIVHSRRTGAITEAVVIFLFAHGVILLSGIVCGQVTGLYIGLAAYGAGMLAQMIWLQWRSRPVMQALQARDV